MLLSVIIPVYNAEKFLQATVESVIAQDFDDFEVILVNDGSKDHSAELCDALAKAHKQVVVIHKENGGVSSARNAGIDAAKGKYVTFIDADDKIGKNMFSDLLQECESKNADKAFCGHYEIKCNGEHILHNPDLPPRKLLNRGSVINSMLLTGCMGDSYMNSVWGGMYKTELLRKHNLRFKQRPMGEDWYFNMLYCDLIESAVYVDEPYYIYVRNGESATARYHTQQFELWLENRELRHNISTKYDFEIDSKSIDSRWVAKVLFYAMKVISCDSDPKAKLKQMFGNDEFIKALKNANQITPRFFVPVVWLLKRNCFNAVFSILKLYAHRIK